MNGNGSSLASRLADSLYTEALLLSDEMRAYFDRDGREDRDQLSPYGRVQFACEALKATTRLMHVIAWLATRRAMDHGELADGEVAPDQRRLAEAAPSETNVLGALPSSARKLILTGIDLYERTGRLADGIEAPIASVSPARTLFRRLESAF
jgi:regulator of CtrA degradation